MTPLRHKPVVQSGQRQRCVTPVGTNLPKYTEAYSLKKSKAFEKELEDATCISHDISDLLAVMTALISGCSVKDAIILL